MTRVLRSHNADSTFRRNCKERKNARELRYSSVYRKILYIYLVVVLRQKMFIDIQEVHRTVEKKCVILVRIKAQYLSPIPFCQLCRAVSRKGHIDVFGQQLSDSFDGGI